MEESQERFNNVADQQNHAPLLKTTHIYQEKYKRTAEEA